MVSRIHTFELGGPGSISSGVGNFNFYHGTECVPFVCVLSCVVSGGGSDILQTTHSRRSALVYLSSVLVHSLLLPLQASDPWAFEWSRGAEVLHLRSVNNSERKNYRRLIKENTIMYHNLLNLLFCLIVSYCH